MNLVPSFVSLSKIIESFNDSINRFTITKSKPCPLDFKVMGLNSLSFSSY